MEKLELKHIAPYLAYRLKAKNTFGEIVEMLGVSNGNSSVNNILWSFISEKTKERVWGYIEQCNPILRPLTDLTKPCLEDGFIAPITMLCQIGSINSIPKHWFDGHAVVSDMNSIDY